MARRQKAPEEKPETAGMMRWLLTYADMITLLLAFFIIMYSYSAVDTNKFRSLQAALAAAFGLIGNPAVLNDAGAGGAKPIVFPASQLQLTQIKNKLEKHILEQKLEPAINLHLNERGLLIRIYSDKVKFALGSAVLSPEFKRILDKVGEILATTPNAIQVNGYTDDSKVRAGKSSNWELSAMRAVNTVRYLQSRRISPERMSATGYGEYSPLYPNSDELRRSLNRRIDIQVLKAPVLDEMMNAGKVEPPTGVAPEPTPVLNPGNGVKSNPLTF